MTEHAKKNGNGGGGDSFGQGFSPLEIALHAGVPRHRVVPLADKLGIVAERVGTRLDRAFDEEQARTLVEALRRQDRLLQARRVLKETLRFAVKASQKKATPALRGGPACIAAPGGAE